MVSQLPRPSTCIGEEPDGQLYEQQWVPPKWGRPIAIGSPHAVAMSPAAVVLPNAERDVFWTGSDGWLYEMTYTGFWSNARRLPSRTKLSSPPSAVVDAHGVVHVYFRGRDRFVWAMTDSGGVWAPAAPLNSGPVGSAPAAVLLPDGKLELFWEGWKPEMLYELPPRGLAKPSPGSGTLGSGPTAILDARGHV